MKCVHKHMRSPRLSDFAEEPSGGGGLAILLIRRAQAVHTRKGGVHAAGRSAPSMHGVGMRPSEDRRPKRLLSLSWMGADTALIISELCAPRFENNNRLRW